MDWTAHRPDGREYGPFNIGAVKELLEHKVITEDTVLTHKTTGKTVTVAQVLNENDIFENTPDAADREATAKDNELSEAARLEEERYRAAEESGKTEAEHDASAESPAGTATVADTPPKEADHKLRQEIDDLRQAAAKLETKLERATNEKKRLRHEAEELRQASEEAIAQRDKLNLEARQLRREAIPSRPEQQR